MTSAELTHSAVAAALGDALDYSWLDELPTTDGPPDLRMGLRRIDEDAWLPADALSELELRHKPQLIADNPDMVLSEPVADDACSELLSLIATATGKIATATSKDVDVSTRLRADTELSAIDAAGRLVPEDLVVLLPDTAGVYRVVAGSVVFPNQWQLVDKIGTTLLETHAPTDGYAELLGSKVDAMFAGLEPGRLMARRNWFFHDHDRYVQLAHTTGRSIAEATQVEPLWLRSERQTLRRLPQTGAMIFTIRTQMAPIAELRKRKPVAAAVADHLAAASPRGLAVKDAAGRADALISYLRTS